MTTVHGRRRPSLTGARPGEAQARGVEGVVDDPTLARRDTPGHKPGLAVRDDAAWTAPG